MDYVEINGRMADGKTNRILRVDKEGRLIAAEKITETFHPFGVGALTATGAQYSTEYTTTAAGAVNEVVESVLMETALPGMIHVMECGLTGSFAAVAVASADIIYTWQARSHGNPDSDWTNLMAATTLTNVGTTNVEYTFSGYFGTANGQNRIPDGCNRVPLEARLLISAVDTSEGSAMTKNSSYFKLTYMPD